MNKKAQELNIKVLIILLIALIVITISIFFFSKSAREIFSNIAEKIKAVFSLFKSAGPK